MFLLTTSGSCFGNWFLFFLMDFFLLLFSRFDLTAVDNGDTFLWLVLDVASEFLNLLAYLVAGLHSAEDTVLAIKVWGGIESHEELRAIGVFTSIGHGQQTSLGVLQLEVLIWEGFAVDALPTSAVLVCEITSLHHKSLDYSVEDAAFEGKGLAIGTAFAGFTSAQLSEVLSSAGSDVFKKLHDDFASGFATDFNVKEDSWVGW